MWSHHVSCGHQYIEIRVLNSTHHLCISRENGWRRFYFSSRLYSGLHSPSLYVKGFTLSTALSLPSLSHSLSLCLIHWSLSLFLHPSLSCLDSNLFGVSISSNRIWIPPAHTVVESSFTGLVWFLTHLLPNIFWVSFRLRLRTYTDLSFQVWSGSSLTLSHYVFSLHLEKCSYITLHLISFGLSNNSTSRSGMLQFILTFESCFFTSKFNN